MRAKRRREPVREKIVIKARSGENIARTAENVQAIMDQLGGLIVLLGFNYEGNECYVLPKEGREEELQLKVKQINLAAV